MAIAVCIQLRLVCNLLDGLMAVEGGKKTKTGEIYNRFPRSYCVISCSTEILGRLSTSSPFLWHAELGWACACTIGALLTAYIRVFGGAVGLPQDFCGPMAKQQRMAVLTGACVLSAVEILLVAWPVGMIMLLALCVVLVGSFITAVRAGLSSRIARRLPINDDRQLPACALRSSYHWATCRWVGCTPTETQRVYFANHTSNLDFVLLWASLPRSLRIKTRPIAAHDYWTKSRLRLTLADKIFHAVLIERQRVTRSNNPIAPMLCALADGCSLIIFPEGGRTLDKPAEFKNGIFILRALAPISNSCRFTSKT